MGDNLLYVIGEDHKILSFNECMGELYPELTCGTYCYEVFKDKKVPCVECPMKKGMGDEFAIYHDTVKKWMNIKLAKMRWQDQRECCVVIASVIREMNRDIVNRLPYMAGYDVVFEMNLTKDSYRKVLREDGDQETTYDQKGLRGLITKTARRLVHPLDCARFLEFWDLDTIMQRIHDSHEALSAEFREQGQWGGWDLVRIVIVPDISVENGEDVILAMYSITEAASRSADLSEKMAEDRGQVDLLTGLPMGKQYQHKVEQYIREQKESCCMIAIDVENFRFFNRWYGREAGDELLREIALFLKNTDAEHDTISGYVGGDNFYIVMPYRQEMVSHVCRGISDVVGDAENTAGFRPAFGACRIGMNEDNFRDIYDHATIAMNRVVGNRELNICWYDDNLIRDIEEELRLIPEVKRGMREREFVFYAQPKYSLSQKRIVGAEALIRWHHRSKGLIPPGSFIPTLEKNGFITELDKYLWEEVCRTIRDWLDRGLDPLPVSVNVSRRDFFSIDVPGYFKKLIEQYEIDACYIEIEITESALADDENVLKQAEGRFREYGFRVLIDDFGSGYSSLNMLKDVRADVLKLDIRFLDLDDDNHDKGVSIMRSVFEMADNLQMPVIAEGVETEEQLGTLREMGCDLVQGYYFYRPMPVPDYEVLFQAL